MEQHFNFKKIFLIILITSLSISALIGIFIFLMGKFEQTEVKLLLSTLAVGGYSLTSLCCSILYEKRKFIHLAFYGMLISIIGFIYTLSIIWKLINYDSLELKILVIFIILSSSIAHACLLLLIKPNKITIKKILFMTIVFIFIVALILIIMILTNFELYEEFSFRLLGVFAILDVLGTIITPILKKLS